MNSANTKKSALPTEGGRLIDDLIKDAKKQGLEDAVRTLEEFKGLLKNKDVLE